MASDCYRFDRFCLDVVNRRLTCDGAPVELNARYLDALILLVRERGGLVSKDRFLDEVWRGVPVTDEALTQGIATIRRRLGDDAARPRFIETAPKHGYRFIAPVTDGAAATDSGPTVRPTAARRDPHDLLWLGGAGTLGGSAAGALGGLIYALAVSASAPAAMGGASVLLVLIVLTALIGLVGGAGVAFGIALVSRKAQEPLWVWRSIGGALGGLIVGAGVNLIGVDAFNLLFGQSPGAITGAFEGLLLGGSVGLGAAFGETRELRLRRGMAIAGLTGGAAGVLIALLGGRLMGGSLNALTTGFDGSRLSLSPIGGLFGEAGFGPVSQTVTAGLEGALFAASVTGAMILARRRSRS